jgi:hypothetical protein
MVRAKLAIRRLQGEGAEYGADATQDGHGVGAEHVDDGSPLLVAGDRGDDDFLLESGDSVTLSRT